MSAYTVFPVTSPASPSHLAAYKALRLTALRTDSRAFSSTYAKEAAFSEAEWQERLDSRLKQTFIASVPSDSAGLPHKRGSDGDIVNAGQTDEWVGVARVIGSTLMTASLGPFKGAGVGANWQAYGLSAMWVHPGHRGRGVGVQLVQACLEWARTNVDDNFASEDREEFEKVMVLLVYNDNAAGRKLYSRIGFTDLEGVFGGEGKQWMMIRV